MDETIKILHLGNLCAPPGESFEDFAENVLLAKKADLPWPADYLVVCGNITSDGSEDAFKAARKAIDLVFKVLVTHPDHKENRLVIVPGKLDVEFGPNGEPDYTKFRHFLSEVYQHELLPGNKLDPATLTVRDTLDLTLISLPGVEVLGMGENKKVVFGKLKGEIEGMRRRRPDYLNRTPNVLISAVPPIRVHKGEIDNAAPDLTRLFDGVRINVHLVGCAPRAVLPPADPFGNDPWCVSCDLIPAEAGKPSRTSVTWPLRMNLIELPRTAANKSQAGARAWHLRQSDGDSSWESRRTPLAVEEERQPPTMEEVYDRFLGSLTTILNENKRLGGILVQGLPGCGLQKLHEWLKGRPNLHGNVPVFPWSWKKEGPVFPFEDIDRWASSIPENSLAVVTVWDPNLLWAESEAHRKRYEALMNFHDRYKVRRKMLKVIHLCHHTERAEDIDPEDFQRVDMKALDSVAVATLGDLYAPKVPVDAEQVNYFTGGYQGFTQGVLDFAHKKLDLWSRAEEVNTDTPWHLICESWSDPEIREDFLRFVLRVSGPGIQWAVFDHIRRKLITSPLREAHEVNFDLNSWQTSTEHRDEWDDVIKLLQVLERFQIIKLRSPACFCVRVVAPFLCKPDHQLFLSYEGPMMTAATEFANKLRAHAESQYTRLRISNYGDDIIRDRQEQRIKPQLEKEMLKARNFCLYHTGGPSIGSEWVKFELDFWGKLEPSRQLIVVADRIKFNNPPPELTEYNLIDARDDDATIKVFKALFAVEYDWSFWQEKRESFLSKDDN